MTGPSKYGYCLYRNKEQMLGLLLILTLIPLSQKESVTAEGLAILFQERKTYFLDPLNF